MPSGMGPDLISAIPSVPESQDEIDHYIINLNKMDPNFTFPGRKREIEGVRLTSDQRAAFGILAGKGIPGTNMSPLKEVIRTLTQQPIFQQLPIEGQARIVERHILKRRNIVSNYLIQTDPDLQEKVIALRQQKAQMFNPGVQL
jgi:hypothetical protein